MEKNLIEKLFDSLIENSNGVTQMKDALLKVESDAEEMDQTTFANFISALISSYCKKNNADYKLLLDRINFQVKFIGDSKSALN